MCDNVTYRLSPQQSIVLVVLNLLDHPLEIDLDIALGFGGVRKERESEVDEHFVARLVALLVQLPQLAVHGVAHLVVEGCLG